MSTHTIVGRLAERSNSSFDPIEGALDALAGIGAKPPPRRRPIRGPRGGRPEKARELWWLETLDPTIVGRREMLYRTRSGRLPAAIPRGARGWVIVLRCDAHAALGIPIGGQR